MTTMTPDDKSLIAQHTAWLRLPMTQSFLKAVQQRAVDYDNTLIESARVKTDEKEQEQLRNCISTCKAILMIANNPGTLFSLSNKQEPTT